MNTTFTAPNKDPDAALDYGMDWSEWLREDETIVSARVFPNDETLTISNIIVGERKVEWRTAGGAARGRYTVTVRITTSLGQIDDRTVRLPMRER